MQHSPGLAIVAGAGPGLGFSLSKALLAAGYTVGALARSPEVLEEHARTLASDRFLPQVCDLAEPAAMEAAIGALEERAGPTQVYIHNAAGFYMAPFLDTPPEAFESSWRDTFLGAVQGTQRVLPGMLTAGNGTVLFIGATASVKAAARFSAFAAAKFALRGLAQSLAREFGPRGIHVAHLIIDGVMWSPRLARGNFNVRQEACLDSNAVAHTCLQLIAQDRSAWTHELDIRPDVEQF